MIKPGSVAWFALHETRLAWRDWAWLLSGGRDRRGYVAVIGFALFFLFLHGLALVTLPRSGDLLFEPPTLHVLVLVGCTLGLYASLMLSQALEAVTRAFYARGDLDLILSSPAVATRLFAVRVVAMTLSVAGLALALGGPAIDVLALRGGAHWLAAYGVVVALAMIAVAVSALATVLLFAAIGPKKTRVVAQIVAAVVGASFVIGVQFLAILSVGSLSRIEFLQSDTVIRHAPPLDSAVWLPAYAATGNALDLAIVLVVAVGLLAASIAICAPRFASLALATAALSTSPARVARRRSGGQARSPAQALRNKEWALLRRDPWLISQSLMQLLYLLPPFFLMWRSFYGDANHTALLVPVLIMAAGQLAGGLAWLAVSGEDAPDLIASAPVTSACAVRAKIEAVMGVIAVIFGPFVVALAVAAPNSAMITVLGVIAAAASATAIQLWFRAQAKRSHFRRRQNSSLIATFAEALSSFSWAGAGALAPVGTWLAVIQGLFAVTIVAGAWFISPARSIARSSGGPGNIAPNASKPFGLGGEAL